MTRRRLAAVAEQEPVSTEVPEKDYFLDPQVVTFSSGCTALDMALGGGWATRRMINIVGDKSTGKTLLAIEACAQFLLKFPDGEIVYCEVEAAFDKGYAAALGMPVDRVRFIDDELVVCKKGARKAKKDADGDESTSGKPKKLKTWRIHKDDLDEDKHEIVSEGVYTVEGLETVLTEVFESANVETLFIIDSYDALSDAAEMERAADDHATYGTAKAKHGSAMFRKCNQKLARGRVTFMIVSQVRANIGVIIGRALTRNGGKCLDFYATHVVWLQKLGNLARERNKIRRVHGVSINAKVDKNKIGLPHREAMFPIIFGYGVEDVISGTNWLVKHNKWNKVFDEKKDASKLINGLDKLTDEAYDQWQQDIAESVREGWQEIEATFLPTRRKYNRNAGENKQQAEGR